jgi:hypothetical protein
MAITLTQNDIKSDGDDATQNALDAVDSQKAFLFIFYFCAQFCCVA